MWFLLGLLIIAYRVYGFSDGFGETIQQGASWMGRSLEEWLNERSLTFEAAGFKGEISIFDLPLFPVVQPEEIHSMLDILIGNNMDGTDPLVQMPDGYRPGNLSSGADPVRTYGQRQQLKALSLPKLAANHHKSIFYYLDLEKAAD